jgi:hypothetical protein
MKAEGMLGQEDYEVELLESVDLSAARQRYPKAVSLRFDEDARDEYFEAIGFYGSGEIRASRRCCHSSDAR